MHSPTIEKAVAAEKQRVEPVAHDSGEGSVDLAAGAGVEELELQAHGLGSRTPVSHCDVGVVTIGRIDERGHTRGGGQHLTQEFEPLCYQFGR